MSGITKVYGSNRANDGVNLSLRSSEIHALLGENGAGKSTLMSILYGLTKPDSGVITVDSERVNITTPDAAIKLGIGMVHQNFMLVPTFTVAENVVLGSETTGVFRTSKAAEDAVAECAERFGIEVDPRAKVDDLPVDLMQRVEILKLLYRGARTLILDEPTSVLGPVESEALFEILENLRSQDAAIVIVTHKLSEVMAMADCVTVLRSGKNVLTATRGEYDADSLARAMVPNEIRPLPSREVATETTGPSRLVVSNLTVRTDEGVLGLDDISVAVDAGEVLGVAGVAGNGQQELLRTLSGITQMESGAIQVDGKDISKLDTRKRRKAGLAVIPDDREGWAIAPTMTVAENLALTRIGTGETPRRFLLAPRSSRRSVKELIEEYEVRPNDPSAMMGSLSGGNKQKVVLARELERRPKIVLAANPTQGLDLGAAALVHRKLLEARNNGAAIVLVSGDLDELFKVSDRLIVLFKGRIGYQSVTAKADYGHVAAAMAGTTLASNEDEQ